MDLNQFRQQYPQYNDIDDETLVNSLYDKFYSDKISKQEFLEKIKPTPPEPDANVGDFFESLFGGTKRIISDSRTALEAPFVSAEEAALRGIKRSDEITERPGTSLEAVKQTFEQEGYLGATGEVLSQVPTAVAEQTPFIASIVLGAKTGAALMPIPHLKPFAALAGSLITPFLQASGGAMERKAQEQMSRGEELDIDKLGAYGTGLGSAALERAAFALSGLSKLFGITLGSTGKVGLASAEKIARRNIGLALASGGGKLVAAEVPTEVTQQMLERYYADLPLTDEDALKEYSEAAFGAALLAPLGMYSGYAERDDAKTYVETKRIETENFNAKLRELFRPKTDEEKNTENKDDEDQENINRERAAINGIDINNPPAGYVDPDDFTLTGQQEIAGPEQVVTPEEQTLDPSQLELDLENRAAEQERIRQEQAKQKEQAVEELASLSFNTSKAKVKKFAKDNNLSDDDYVIRERRNIFTKEGKKLRPGEKVTKTKQAGAREKGEVVEQTTGYYITPRTTLDLGTNDSQAIKSIVDYVLNDEGVQVGTKYDLVQRKRETSEGLKVTEKDFKPITEKRKNNIDRFLKDTLNKAQYSLLSGREDYKKAKTKKGKSFLDKVVEGYQKEMPSKDVDTVQAAAQRAQRINEFDSSNIGQQVNSLAQRINAKVPEFLKTGSVLGSTRSIVQEAESTNQLFEDAINDYIFEEAMDTAEGGIAQIAISATKADREAIKGRRKKIREEFINSDLLNNFLDNSDKYSREYIEEQVKQNKDAPILSAVQAGLTKNRLTKNQVKENDKVQSNTMNYSSDSRAQKLKKRLDKGKEKALIEKQFEEIMSVDKEEILDNLGLDPNATIDDAFEGIVEAIDTSEVTRVLKDSPNMRVALTNMLNVLQKKLNRVINDTTMDQDTRLNAQRVLEYQIQLVNVLRRVDGLEQVTMNIITMDQMQKRKGKNSTTKGLYVSDTNTNKNEVYIVDNMTSALVTRVFLHEATHMATTYGLTNLTNQELAQWNSIFEAAKQRAREEGVKDKDMGKPGLYYGLKNLKEFIAEAFSNPEFQNFLQSAPSVVETQPVSLFDRFIQAVKNMLGAQALDNTLLKDTMNMSGNLFSFGPRPAPGSRRAKQLQRRINEIKVKNAKDDGLPDYVIDFLIPPSERGVESSGFDDTQESPQDRRARIKENNSSYVKTRPGNLGSFFRQWFRDGQESVNKISEKFVSATSRIQKWEQNLRRSGLLVVGQKGFNNIYSQITLMNGKASNYLKALMPSLTEFEQSIAQFYKLYQEANPNSDDGDARAFLQDILTGQHELERREIKYMLSVPLSDKKIITYLNEDGKVIATSPAELRNRIMNIITSSKSPISKKELDGYRQTLLQLADPNNTIKGQKTVDEVLGVRYKQIKKGRSAESKGGSIDIKDAEYDVTNMSYDAATQVRNEFDNLKRTNPALYNSMKKIQENMNKIQRGVKPNDKNPVGVKGILELNQLGNFNPVQAMNVIDMYGWQNYIPLKGRKEDSEDIQQVLDPTSSSIKLSRKDKSVAATFEGNVQDAADPFAQVIVDASQAAARAGRIKFTEALYNAINDKVEFTDDDGQQQEPRGLLNGKVEKIFTYEQRYKNDPDIQKALDKKNTVVHFLEDGSLVILSIKDDKMLTAVRGLANEKNTLLDIANSITGGIGQLHTRFNLKFAPLNFVRDAITNLYLVGTDLGLRDMAGFANNVAEQVYKGGMKNTWKIISMYNKDQLNELKKYVEVEAKKGNTYPRDMVEYLEQGGMVAITQSLSNQTAFERTVQEISPSKILQTKKQITTFFDTYMGTFELASRVAAYRVFRDNYIARNAPGKSGEKVPENVRAAAMEEGAVYAKELANFEKMGTSGRTLGGFYMFFRASTVGAARALQSISPALMSLDTAVKALDPTIKNNPEALAEFKKNYMRDRQRAQGLMMSGLGLGAAMYYLSAMMSGGFEDDGEESTINDDLSRWTRYARFDMSSVPGFEKGDVIQIPWGFGLGGIPAIGAQVVGLSANENSPRSIMANMLEITLDSFAPIPVSRIDPTEDIRSGATWFVDSISPTALRPIIEFAMNTNAFGSPITNLMYSRRYGSAYQSMGNTPQLFKDTAINIAEATDGAIVPNPDVLYFFANNYLDAVFTTAQNLYSLNLTVQGKKDFEAKFDTVLFGSFFSKYSKIDQRAYSRATKKIQQLESRLKLFEDTNPQKYFEVLQKYPMGPTTVDMYNDMKGQLNKLNQQANVIRKQPGLTPKERKSLLEPIENLQLILKRQIAAAVDMALPE
jgi:hypothetical protein